ncbi:MAG: hypothetical protein ABIQ95_04565 [Bdellovibrionia bacterium]
MKAIYELVLPLNEGLKKTLLSANRPDIAELRARVCRFTKKPDFEALDNHLAVLESKIEIGLNNAAATDFKKGHECILELLDYRNDLFSELQKKIREQVYIRNARTKLKGLEPFNITKLDYDTYCEVIDIQQKSEVLAITLPCPYFSRSEIHELKKHIDDISKIIANSEKTSALSIVEKRYQEFIREHPNIPELKEGSGAIGKKQIRMTVEQQFISGSDLKDGATAYKIVVADVPQSLAETTKQILENKEKSKKMKEEERVKKLYSSDREQKIAKRLDDLCIGFTKEAETKESRVDATKADAFIKRISRANHFWSRNHRNWTKIVDYFREVYKDAPVKALKDFLLRNSGNFDYKNVDLLLPTLFLNVSQPKLEVPKVALPTLEIPKKPEPTPSNTGTSQENI